MDNHFGDRLLEAVREKGTAGCVGFDPVLPKLPSAVLGACSLCLDKDGLPASSADVTAAVQAIEIYGTALIEIVAPYVPVIKINIAYFEVFYAEGIALYHRLISQARDAGLLVIGDVKRSDIGHTAAQYAQAQMRGMVGEANINSPPDAITLNPYFGSDGIDPFVEVSKDTGRGLFVLVQTSNPSADQVQGLTFEDGDTVCQKIAKLVDGWAGQEALIGESGYSTIGAVVSPRDLPSTKYIRKLMPRSIFLVPGFGAQGRSVEEVARCFKDDGTGAIVAASRSVMYAYHNDTYTNQHTSDWKSCIDHACRDFARQINSVMA